MDKAFGSVRAVDQATMRVLEGELLVLLGPSGCGKTTLLRVIAGLERPDAGKIAYGKRGTTERASEDHEIAMVFQGLNLYPHKSVAANLEFPLKIGKIPVSERLSRLSLVTALLEIEDLLTRYPHQLSGGEAQRVALAKALMRRPDLILLDEPLTNLDTRLRLRLRHEIRRSVKTTGVTTVLVTHDQSDAMAVADRLAVMRAGRILQLGTAAEIFARPATAFVASFIGDPPMNLLEARRVEKSLWVGETRFPLPLNANGRLVGLPEDLVLGARPESFTLTPGAMDGLIHFDSTVELTEPLEPIPRVLLRIGEESVTVDNPDKITVAAGDVVTVGLEPSQLYLFRRGGLQERLWPV